MEPSVKREPLAETLTLEEQERREDEIDNRLSDEALAEMREKRESLIAWEEVKRRLGL